MDKTIKKLREKIKEYEEQENSGALANIAENLLDIIEYDLDQGERLANRLHNLEKGIVKLLKRG